MTTFDTLLEIARKNNHSRLAIIERAKDDPIFAALYQCWLIATDIPHEASPGDMDDALTRIDRIAGQAIGVRS